MSKSFRDNYYLEESFKPKKDKKKNNKQKRQNFKSFIRNVDLNNLIEDEEIEFNDQLEM